MKTYTYKLYSNSKYQSKFNQWVGVCRLVYNLAKETKETVYRDSGVSLSKYDLMKQLPELKKEYDWISEVGSQTLQSVIERLDNSFKKFFNGGGYPKWAVKNKYKSFKFKQGVKQTDKGFVLPKFGKVRVFNSHRKVIGKIKCASMIQKADGIYLHVVSDEDTQRRCESQASIGIDMGITHFLTTSEGVHISNPRFLNNQLKKLRIEQRALSRKKKGSSRWHSQVDKVSRLHKKVADCRSDFLHKVSTDLSKQYGKVVVEDLNIQDMTKNKRLSRHILDCGWGKFFNILEYKTEVIRVDPKYTSQTCPECDHVAKENRLSQSLFKCTSCGHSENADVVGAKNIRARAFAHSR